MSRPMPAGAARPGLRRGIRAQGGVRSDRRSSRPCGTRARSDSDVVDLGAGTGVFAIAAAPFCAPVVAVDVSPAMTAALRRRVARPRVRQRDGRRRRFPLVRTPTVHPLDFVYTRNAPASDSRLLEGRLRSSHRIGSCAPVASCGCAIWCSTSCPRTPRSASRPGWPAPCPTRRSDGPPPSSRSTSAASSAPSAGCSTSFSNSFEIAASAGRPRRVHRAGLSPLWYPWILQADQGRGTARTSTSRRSSAIDDP